MAALWKRRRRANCAVPVGTSGATVPLGPNAVAAFQTTYAATPGGRGGADGSTPKPPETGVSVRGDSPARRSSAVTRSTMLSSVTRAP